MCSQSLISLTQAGEEGWSNRPGSEDSADWVEMASSSEAVLFQGSAHRQEQGAESPPMLQYICCLKYSKELVFVNCRSNNID